MSRYFSLGYRYFAEETLARDRRLLSVIPWDKRDNYELEVTYVAKVTAVNRLDGHRVTLAEASEVQAVPEQTLNDYVVTGKLQPFKVQLHKLEVTMQLAARQAGKAPEKKLKMQITLLEHRRLPSLQNELLLHITTAVLSLKVHNFIEN